jgi:predicted CXXCH cytochrome family protein
LRKGLKGFLLIFSIVLALALSAPAYAVDSSEYPIGNPHAEGGEGNCSLCHTRRPPQLIDDHVETCTNCHLGNIENHPVTRHPIDVAVEIMIPSPLPLTKQERIVCSTCHDPHDEHGFRSLLRVEYHKLCVQCHRGY